ncbi:hybrid sensor histidine kinase/response regulator [Phormidium tenue FACHB-886]|nr:hybrid sensor histidine kinase/response regulator [Phormidium tenue FACHB-886]
MLSKGRILVVDDTPANLEVICQMLSEAGYFVMTAIDGERALKRVHTHPPDLILLDVEMPGIDGFETCHRLKSNPATVSIPIIFITALSDAESKVKGFTLGAVDYITKPFEANEMLARVHTHLHLQRLSQHLERSVAERTIELETALEKLRQSQLQLVQSEKMSALGNLVAGVAHEINNPVSCIVGNVDFVQNCIDDLLSVIDLYSQEYPQPSARIADQLAAVDLEYLLQDLPKLIKAMKAGGDRIIAISKSLCTFSRIDSVQKQPFNLHDGIDSTVLILRHRLKANEHRPAIEVITHYDHLPEVNCFPGQLNQVFMNILSNAIDALEAANQERSFAEIEANPNQITIWTSVEDEQIKIGIADNGIGMTEEVKAHIFDHLFTTKAVGKGTGLGLAIAHQIIVEKHGGVIEVNSDSNSGSEFVIHLPLLG